MKKSVIFLGLSLYLFSSSLAFLPGVVNATENTTTSSLESRLENVQLYEVPKDFGASEKEAEGEVKIKFQKSLKLAEKYLKKQNYDGVYDLNDPNFQKALISLGGVLFDFNPEDQKLIEELVKFMDLYENYDKNEKILKLKEKARSEELSEADQAELISILPVDDLGPATLETGSAEPTFTTATVYSNGYNNIAARDYAYIWTTNDGRLLRNTDYGWYSRHYGCVSCWNDCTNFVSQVLAAGGMDYRQNGVRPYLDGDNYWFYRSDGPSSSWGQASAFHTHWKSRTSIASYTSQLQTGDVVSIDFERDGDIDHLAVITKNWGDASNQKYLTQHTTDKKELTTIAYLYDRNYAVYGFEMDRASN